MSDIAAALVEQGIRLKDYRPGEHRSTCPVCSRTRKKKTDPCLAVKIDNDGGAAWTCHHCGVVGNLPSGRDKAPVRSPSPKPRKQAPPVNAEQSETLFQWFAKRKISRATVERFGIFATSQFFPQTGQEERCIAFPYRLGGDTVNHKYRTAGKQFRQDKGAVPTLYNIDALPGADTVIIVEGEMDVLALAEAGFDNVVTLPTGAPPEAKNESDPDAKRYAALVNGETELAKVQKFILAGDADGPGRAHVEELARRLGKERCWRVSWPSINDVVLKDANEVLIEHGPDMVRECIEGAEPFPIAGLHETVNYEADLLSLYRGERSNGLSTGWPTLDGYMTIRPGDLSVVTGIPNHGKSEFIDALAVNMARLHGWRFALCSFENAPDEHIAKLAEKYVHAPFWEGPTPRMGEIELSGAIGWLQDHFTFIRAEDEAPTIDWILEKARAAVLRYGIRGLVIDPWNEVEANRPSAMSETEYVSQTLGKVRRFAQTHECHVWFVAHPMKMRKEPGESAVPAPSLYDISGSAHWANKADFGITVHRPTDTGSVTEIYIRKVRRKWLGKKGVVKLTYDRRTGEYRDAA